MDVQMCTPSDDKLVIIESLHVSSIHKFSVSTQVYRRVYGVCHSQDVYFDNEKLNKPLSGLQILQNFISGGDRVTTKPTGEELVITRYMGSRNYLKPVGDLNVNNEIGKALSKDYYIGRLGQLFAYGTDPIPDVKLFGNASMTFSMAGNGAYPVAVAVYDSATGNLSQVLDPVEKKRMILELVK
ncbi:hypothetical protein [Marinobacterium stanieri]|uniref:Uncharacterized protein n=1 Tax=Marinobacterium stanieri TaxID=49186 RepID=A0A1N6Q3P4_9GAMM|nr:hypothetical protein [Marinobacterium stanieri]SIQ11156.1 hypothetical protein SAMN05421647_102229 [Marinobacterium stanieri]